MRKSYRPTLELLEGRLVPSLMLVAERDYGPAGALIVHGTVSGFPPGVNAALVSVGGANNGQAQSGAGGAFNIVINPYAAGATTVQAAVGGQTSNLVNLSVTQDAPVISSFAALQGVNGLYTFQGRVADEYSPGLHVYLSGIPALSDNVNGWTMVNVSSDGWFRYTCVLGARDAGWVTAQAYDWYGLESAPARVLII